MMAIQFPTSALFSLQKLWFIDTVTWHCPSQSMKRQNGTCHSSAYCRNHSGGDSLALQFPSLRFLGLWSPSVHLRTWLGNNEQKNSHPSFKITLKWSWQAGSTVPCKTKAALCLFSAALACPSDEEYGLSTERLIVQLLVQPVTVPNPTLPLFTSLGVVDLVSSLSDKKKKQGPKCAEKLPAAGKRHCPWGKYCRNSTTSRNPGIQVCWVH